MGKKSKTTQSSTSTSSIDPYTQALQRDNYAAAQAKFGNATYSPLTGAQIQAQMNPYTQDVVDATQADLERQRQMAVNNTADAATAAHAFGGDRHGVAEALTNEASQRTAGNVLAQLRQQGFTQAQNVAQQENTAAQNYPLLIQQLLNGTLGTVTPTVTSSGTSTTKSGAGTLANLLNFFGTNAQLAGSVMGAG